MSRIHLAGLAFLLAAPLLLPNASWGGDADAVVSGTGKVVIKRLPQVLRAQFVVTGQAKDAAGAIASLKEAQAAARQKLAEIGAAANSIEIGPTRKGGAPPSPRPIRQIHARSAIVDGPGPIAKPAMKPQMILISSTITAEWPLTAANADELFIAGSALEEKIKSAGVGKPDPKKLTPEQAEAAEEATGGPASSEPTIQYLCRISEADRAAASAEAFQKAKADAADLAKAAGSELASLRQITRASDSPMASDDSGQALNVMLMQQLGGASPTATELKPGEAAAATPVMVELQITVTASFAVK